MAEKHSTRLQHSDTDALPQWEGALVVVRLRRLEDARPLCCFDEHDVDEEVYAREGEGRALRGCEQHFVDVHDVVGDEEVESQEEEAVCGRSTFARRADRRRRHG